IPEIKEKTNDSELIHLAYSLSTYANKRNADEEIEFEENENPVKEMGLKVKRYLESTKKPEVLRDICEAFVETNSDYLGYLIVEMGWEFGGISERIPMYLLSNQLTKVEQLGKEVVPVLYRILKKEQKNLKLKNAARNAIRKTTNQDLIDEYFEIYFKNSDPELEEIFKEQDWKNSEKSKTAVYFVMSGQSNRYSEIEPEGYKIILEAYNKMNFEKRYNLLENIIESKSERLIDFLLYLFTSETNPRILQLLSQAVNVFYEKTYHRVKAMIPKLDKPILRELSLALAKVKRERSSELLYKTALKEKGHMALWILKILDEIRWQPRDIKERAFFFELYNLRDAIFHMLEERLESNDMEIAVSAARTFAEIGDESILVTLMRMADEGQERLQKECAYTIGYICTINPEKSLNQIQHYRRNSIYITYNDVRKAFHASNDKEQMLILKGYFEKGNKVLRSFAAAVISNIKKMESIPLLHLMMEDTDPFVRYLAIKGMNTLSVAENARYLFEEISADDDRNRMLAAEAYAKVGKEKYFEKFQQKLQTGEATYPDSLIHILSLRKGEDAKDTFERVLTHPAYGPTAKTEAIKALARIGGEKLEYKLITDAKKVAETYNRPTEVLPYIDAMEIIGGTKVYRALEAIFENGNWEMRRNVIRVLGNIPHRICMVTIIKALDDSNAWVQLQALESLNKFYNSHFKFEDNEKDLKLIAAVIMRLKKFELNDLIDKEFPVYKIFTELDIMIFRHQLTMFYAEKKRILTGKEVHFKKIAERRDYRELVREAMVSRKGAPIPSMVTATAGEAITTPTTGDTTAEETETIVVKTEVQKKEKILRKIKKPLVKKSKIVGGKVKKTALSKLKKKE
ncbi:MAG: HEAT repeat domain-containing protein, partial [Vulcanimicrobiota bacterium]